MAKEKFREADVKVSTILGIMIDLAVKKIFQFCFRKGKTQGWFNVKQFKLFLRITYSLLLSRRIFRDKLRNCWKTFFRFKKDFVVAWSRLITSELFICK